MVIIRNRTILWTNHEQYIGTSYDNNSETRIFQVPRILPAGTDIADFVFNITIKFSNGQNSVIMLGKETVDDVINLTWQIGRNSLLAPGPAFVQISATDSYGTIKWSTYESAVYIGNYIDYEHAGDVEMSEFERLEAYYYDLARKMVAVFESEELREKNEATRQTNEAQRAQETEELIARSEEALRIAEGAVGTVSEKLGLAKSYAVGDEEAREGSSTDNAKYYKEQIQASAAQIETNRQNIVTANQNIETNRQGIILINAKWNDIFVSGAGPHNSLYRGKYLGDHVTAEQWAAIDAGTFEGLYIGDYWVINGVTYRIAAFDYHYNCGDTDLTKHHVVLVPDNSLYKAKMNTSNVTTGGYTGSAMYKSNLAQAKTTIKTAFGSAHVLTKRELLTNAVNDNTPSGWAWFDSDVELMNEVQVYGSVAWGAHDGNGYNVALGDGQFPLFMFDRTKLHNREDYWLRDVASAIYFSIVDYYGHAYCGIASASFGVRPCFCICA
ncbi:MAG: hypothetical protein PUB12_00730 [[Clostridium] aminophilum]|uniref:hypothetical protein n=1 Tax=[Clostridium] aminophilum TaxID=1526 RepID=UPI0026EDBB09|nr:hypothetical protein [[Clostridium] aminophilum]MDD6195420.1 hypothetical protein [[Clostridium] aminophilum]